MKVILEGDERTVRSIMTENKVRVGRGQVTFTPADSDPVAEDEKGGEGTDTKEEPKGDTKDVNLPADEKGGEGTDTKEEPKKEEKKPKK